MPTRRTLALALAGALVAGASACTSSDREVTSGGSPEASSSAHLPVPDGLGGARRTVPLGNDLGESFEGARLSFDGRATTVTLRSGTVVEVQHRATAGSDRPTTSAAGAERSAAWASPSGTVALTTTRPLRGDLLEAFARATVALPGSLAAGAADGKVDPVRQSFALDGLTFDRELATTFHGSPFGLSQRVSVRDVEPRGGIVTSTSDLGGDLGSAFPRQLLGFPTADGRRWLVLVPPGLEVTVAAGDRASSVEDDLTGASYLLVRDDDGDDRAVLRTATTDGSVATTLDAEVD